MLEYAKLRGVIREKYKTEYAFAKALGVTRQTLGNKLSGRSDWSLREIEKAMQLLFLPVSSVCDYFFTPQVNV